MSSIQYKCRHCQVVIGRLDQREVDIQQLGFHHLDYKERLEMISYLENGDMEVKTICEDCQEALERNPDFHQLNSFIQ